MTTSRPSRARRRRQPALNLQKIGGIALGGIALVVVMLLFLLRPESVPRDSGTLCPDSGPSQVTAILVDTTDRIGAPSRADILGRLDDLVLDSRTDEMMISYDTSLVAGDSQLLPPRLPVCNPGDPDSANPLISSPELIRQRLEERYKKPLSELFQKLVNGEQSASSPIMETIQAISITVLARRAYADIPKRLILISDLLQHSEHLSLYANPLDYDAFARTAGSDALRTNLRGVAIEVFLIQRQAHAQSGTTLRLIEFWERWFKDQSGRLERATKINGLN